MKLAKKLQVGGQLAAPGAEAAPAGSEMEQQGAAQDPLMQIAQLFAQGLQEQNCEALAQGAQMFLELISQAQGGAEGQPVFGKGGKLASRKQAQLQLVVK